MPAVQLLSVPHLRCVRGATRLFVGLSRCAKGVAAVEFAFLVPIMFMLFIGTVEFSQALTVDRRVTQIASASADLIARQKKITTSEVEGVMQIIDHLMRPYDPSNLRVTVVNVVAAINDANNTTVCWSYQHNGGASSYSDGQTYALPAGFLEAGNSVIVAEVVYNYQPLIFEYFLTGGVPLRETFYLKPRQSSFVEYNGVKCT
jgi:Flp pilus assembly protein TadG